MAIDTIPLSPLLSIVLVTLGVVLRVKIDASKGEHTLTHEAKTGVGSLSFESDFFGEVLFNELASLILDEDLVDSIEDFLGGTLKKNSGFSATIFVLGVVLHVSDDKVELDAGVERNLIKGLVFEVSANWVHGSDGFESVFMIVVSNVATVLLHDSRSEETNDTCLGGVTIGGPIDNSSALLLEGCGS